MEMWTRAEENFIKENWQEMTDEEMTEELDRTKNAVKNRRLELGFKKFKPFTEEEKEFIRKNYEDMKDKELAEEINRPWKSIKSVRHRMGLTKSREKILEIRSNTMTKYNLNRESKWTDEEIQFVKENWKNLTDEEMSKKLDRTVSSVRTKRQGLGLHRRHWKDREIEFLKENYENMSDAELADDLCRSKSAVRGKRNKLGLHRQKNDWSNKEEEFLRENWQDMTDKELANNLDRTRIAVKQHRQKMNLEKNGGRPSIWTEEEDKYLSKNYGNMDTKAISNELGYSIQSVYSRAEVLNLEHNIWYTEKEEEFIENNYKERSDKEIAEKLDRSRGAMKAKRLREGLEKGGPLKYEKRSVECDDGHIVDSKLERIVDNWLFHHGILHQIHKEIGYKGYKCDFYIPEANVYIEVWGLEGMDFYDKRTKQKHKIYNDLGLNLINIYPTDNFRDKLEFLLEYSTDQTTIGDFSER